MSQPNCDFCGKFISWTRYVIWTNFGTYGDLEPPDDSYAHIECYQTTRSKTLLDDARYTWHPAQIIGDTYGTSKQEGSEDSSHQA